MKILAVIQNLAEATEGSVQELSTQQMIQQFLVAFGLPILLLVAMWFFMIRPQRKEQKLRAAQRDSMKVGDRVVTIGGIVGRVVNIKDGEITISTSVANTMMTFRKEAIDQVIKPVSDEA